MPLALLAFLGFLVALIPAGLVQVQLEREARHERSVQIADQARRLVALVGRQVDSAIESAHQSLRTIAAHEAVRSLRPSAECNEFLARVVSAAPRYATASLFGRDGRVICAAAVPPMNLDVSDRPYFQAALRAGGGLHVGEFAEDRLTGVQALHLAAPMFDSAGEVRAVLVIVLSLRWLNAELAEVMLPPGSASTIADRNGVILARSREPERFVGTRMPQFALDLMDRPAPGVLDGPALDGVRRIAAYLPLAVAPEGLFITVGLEADSVLGEGVAEDRRTAIKIVGSLLLTFLLWLIVFHTAVEKPVQRLLATAQRWSRREWQARVGEIRGGQEFKRLAAAFDSMADTVQTGEADRRRAATRLAAVVRVAPQIVMTADAEGKVDSVNWYWEELTGRSLEASRGDGWLAAVHPEDREQFETAWGATVAQARRRGEEDFSRELRLCHEQDGRWRWFVLRGTAIRDGAGEPSAWAMVGIDIHDLRASQARSEEVASQLRATYENTPVGLCLLDRELKFIAINEALAASSGQPAEAHIGRTLEDAAPQLAGTAGAAMRRVLATGQIVEELEITTGLGDALVIWLCSCHPVFAPDGGITGVSGSFVDITARKRIEESERLLSREVDHRAQNALAVVRGLIRLSAADAPDDVPALVELLEGRIAAMSRAHTLLAREKWVGADLQEVIAQEVAPHGGRVRAEGPAVRLTAGAAQPLTLVLHEMLTNAVKYGALSSPAGAVLLRWSLVEGGLHVEWQERGGPRLEGPPKRHGFGLMLVDANLRGQLAGSIERFWEPPGLRCSIRLGANALAASALPEGQATRGDSGGSALEGRRVLVVPDDAVEVGPLVDLLLASGCDVRGPATDFEDALALIDAESALDLAVIGGTLQGRSLQPLTRLLQRRARGVLHVGGLKAGSEPFIGHHLEAPFTPARVRFALLAALGEGQR